MSNNSVYTIASDDSDSGSSSPASQFAGIYDLFRSMDKSKRKGKKNKKSGTKKAKKMHKHDKFFAKMLGEKRRAKSRSHRRNQNPKNEPCGK